MKTDSTPVFLITGASGFVGSRICRHLAPRFTVVGAYRSHLFCLPGCSSIALDITDRRQVHEAIHAVRPTHIIHGAAMSAPDTCENKPQEAWDINCTGTQNMLEAASAIGSRFVFISTDLVFDGRLGNYTEADPVNPINQYARTKVEAEKLCLNQKENSLIVRITLQYGLSTGSGASFCDQLIDKLSLGQEISLFTDQIRTPTYVLDTACGLEHAALHGSPGDIFHLAGPETISRYGFAVKLASIFNLPVSLLKPCSMDDAATIARRPRDASLLITKFTESFQFTPRNIQQGLAAMYQEYNETI
ncbi:MAG: NAD(P)-dependent oxidoreductase [Deltaproteobacteria bacterium]|nr:NAD(P)-dependent oxidoreductase [Deltaproteobacteria bacterium]